MASRRAVTRRSSRGAGEALLGSVFVLLVVSGLAWWLMNELAPWGPDSFERAFVLGLAIGVIGRSLLPHVWQRW